ncbi:MULTISPECIES: LysR family transcriptional regulator [Cupriavidus]
MAVTARQIEAFRAIMVTGSTKSAAEMLFVTQPVVSRLLTQLEHTLGYALFERRGNSLAPNEKALILFESAKKVHSEIGVFQEISRNIASLNFSKLRIFCSPTLATSVLPKIIGSRADLFSSTQFEIYSRLIDKIPSEIISNKNAIGISIWPTDDGTVDCDVLAERKLMIAVNRQDELSRKRFIGKQDLVGKRIITHHHSLPMGKLIEAEFSDVMPRQPPAFLIENSEIAYSLVKENLGVAIVDGFSTGYLTEQGLAVVPFDTDITTNLCLITSRFHRYGSELDAIRQALLAWLDAGGGGR